MDHDKGDMDHGFPRNECTFFFLMIYLIFMKLIWKARYIFFLMKKIYFLLYFILIKKLKILTKQKVRSAIKLKL